MDCGKIERFEVHHGQHINSDWAYYGKLNINFCKTSKYFFRCKDQTEIFENLERVPNSCYDPKVKPKYVEMWSCPQCMAQLKKMETPHGKGSLV